jgi:uncharacterized repeat protein (TIGR03803 family)
MNKFNWGLRACSVFLLWAVTAVALPPPTTFTTLHSFGNTDGGFPFGGLVQATNGNLYGTTFQGGTNNDGTVFSITTGGTLATLHSFDGTDGFAPETGLVQATNGKFYGVTEEGGGPNNYGTVFSITASGALTALHVFGFIDGAFPYPALVQGSNGKFYGTTNGGGGTGCGGSGCGTVFSITVGGTLTPLHSFDGTDGSNPVAGLVQGTNGKFYGTTQYRGANPYGTVFSITTGGTLATLHNFDFTDGAYPYAGLVQGTNGKFYGTTYRGGANGNFGTVFSITAGGTLTTIYNFCSQTNCTDGMNPEAGLVQGTDGKFYGTTSLGGANGDGTVFSITTGGTLTTLYNFCSQTNCTDGQNPYAGLVQDTNGTFYGTTVAGGTNGNYGTVFSLSVGLGPFVETNPTAAKVGKAVKILGTSLTGSTSVTFNGTAAAFTVVSASEITTTVPAGATTGTVQVVTPGGTLSSNVPFRVE